jgi:hypothetical protein
MTFFTLLYLSGEDGGAPVTPPTPPSGPGFVGGGAKEPRDERRRKAKQRDKGLPPDLLLRGDRPPPIGETPEAGRQAETSPLSYEDVAGSIERAARAATAELMRKQLEADRKRQAALEAKRQAELMDEDEAIALLLLMG